MTIQNRVISLAGLIVALLVGIYTISNMMNSKVELLIYESLNRDIQRKDINDLKQLTGNTTLLAMDLIVDVSTGVSEERRKLAETFARENRSLTDHLSKTELSPSIRKKLNEYVLGRDSVKIAVAQLMIAIDQKKDASVMGHFDDVIDTRGEANQTLLSEIDAEFELQSKNGNEGLLSSLSNSSLILNIVFALGFVLILSGLVYFYKSILKSIESFKSALNQILKGDGDLTRRIELQTKDEMQELANLINDFFGTLASLVSQVKNASELLSQKGVRLQAVIGSVNDSSIVVAQSVEHSSHESKLMQSNFSNVSNSSLSISDNIQSVSAAVEELSASMNEIGRSAGKSTEVAKDALQSTLRALETIEGLRSVAQNINSVSDYISEIAEQTNLLSLNAAIEAAGAGEAGKGFAVVASEVKELAKQAQNASRNIIEQIRAVQEGSANALVEVNSISKVMRDVTDHALSITAAVEEQSSVTRSISVNIQQVNTEDLLNQIKSVE